MHTGTDGCAFIFFATLVQKLLGACKYASLMPMLHASDKILALKQQIMRHLNTGAISKIEKSPNQFLSRVFTVKKSNGENRLIIDLSVYNKFILKVQFKMENQLSIKSLIQEKDFLASIDRLDAFFTIPLHSSSNKLLFYC